MKRCLGLLGVSLLAVIGLPPCVRAQSLSSVVAQSRYPWSDLVDIDYEIEGVTDAQGFEIVIFAVDGTGGRVALSQQALDKTPPVVSGSHRVTWNPLKQLVPVGNAPLTFSVELQSKPSLYCVIDLSGGEGSASYAVSHMNEIPGGTWSDEYRTSKLVMRRIPAGTFMMGSPENELGRPYSGETLHQVTLTKDYYIGVFEVTQGQWERVKGAFSFFTPGADRPADNLGYSLVRGSKLGASWPTNALVDADSFLGILRAKTGHDGLDLPTEAQWEYACRAGTTSSLNSGKEITATGPYDICENLAEVARYSKNLDDGKDSYGESSTTAGSAKVGMYRPNNWGLYDMHGNVEELCLDWLGDYEPTATDPVGAMVPPAYSPDPFRVSRGGSWGVSIEECRSARRSTAISTSTWNLCGFRLAKSPQGSEETQAVQSTMTSASVSMEEAGEYMEVEPGVALSLRSPDWWGGDGVIFQTNGVPIGTASAGAVFNWTPPAGAGLVELSCTDGTHTESVQVWVEEDILVTNVRASQRYPWNNFVDIDYIISGVPDGSRYAVSIEAGNAETNFVLTTLAPDPSSSRGSHRVTWDPDAQGVKLEALDIVYTVKLMKRGPRYCVVDLSNGISGENYSMSYLESVPKGGWPDEYKTKKLVLRRIPAGSFMMGSPDDEFGKDFNEPYHKVTLTKDYYMGVFEVTQRQWELVTGEANRAHRYHGDPAPATDWNRPVDRLYYDLVRGENLGAKWPASNEVDADTFLGKLRSRTGNTLFDLPTEAQWEYACRAGTTTSLNSGKNITTIEGPCPNVAEVGRYLGNAEDGKGVYTNSFTAVGMYLPNDWGLYDMHGNVGELCLDWAGPFSLDPTTDPHGPAIPVGRYPRRLWRGGCWTNAPVDCRSAVRPYIAPNDEGDCMGIRLVKPVDDASEGSTAMAEGSSAPSLLSDCSGEIIIPPGKTIGVTYSDRWDGLLGEQISLGANGREFCRCTGEGVTNWTAPNMFTNVSLSHLMGMGSTQLQVHYANIKIWQPTISVSIGPWGTATLSTNGIDAAVFDSSMPSNAVRVSMGAPVSLTFQPNLGFGVRDIDVNGTIVQSNLVVRIPTVTNDYAYAARFQPVPTTTMKWKFAKSTKLYYAQIAFPWYAGYGEAFQDLRFTFADHHINSTLYAQLRTNRGVAPVVSTSPVVNRYVTLVPGQLPAQADGSTVCLGVSDATLRDPKDTVPANERAVGLYVKKIVRPGSGNEATANVENFIGYLAWTTAGEACYQAVGENYPDGPVSSSPISVATLNLAYSLGLSPLAFSGSAIAPTLQLRMKDFALSQDGAKGSFELIGKDQAEDQFYTMSPHPSAIRLWTAEYPVGPWREIKNVTFDSNSGFSVPNDDRPQAFYRMTFGTVNIFE